MTKHEVKARNHIVSKSTNGLILLFEMTEVMDDPHIPTVRGWLMDELERRNPAAFDAWIESMEDSPRAFF